MAGYDPFVELLDGTPIYSDGVAVTTEGVFPLVAALVEVTGAAQAAVETVGLVLIPGHVSGAAESAAEANGALTQVHTVGAAAVAVAETSATITHGVFITGAAQAAVSAVGSPVAVSDVFSGWGIPAGVP